MANYYGSLLRIKRGMGLLRILPCNLVCRLEIFYPANTLYQLCFYQRGHYITPEGVSLSHNGRNDSIIALKDKIVQICRCYGA